MFKGSIIAFLFLAHSAAFAANSGLYFIARVGTGLVVEPSEERFINRLIKRVGMPFRASSDTAIPLSEFDILTNQVYGIASHVDKSLMDDVCKSVKPVLTGSLPPNLLEGGVGYHFKFIMPFAIEFKGISNCLEDNHHLFFSGAAKVFLPVSARNKLYLKLGKCFLLNPNQSIKSLWVMNPAVCKDIKDTVWESTPQKQWQRSRTVFGAGWVRRMSSRIEADLGFDGYTTRESTNYHYTVSIGVNYLFE